MISFKKVAIKFARNLIRPLIPQGAYARFVYLWHALVDRGGDLDWSTLLVNPGLDPVLREMLVGANEIHGEGGVSKYWAALNLKNAQQLTALGFDKFKQTIALNYFTSVSRNNYQLQFFKAHLSIKKRKRIAELAKTAVYHECFSIEESLQYNEMTYLLWEYLVQEFPDNPYVLALEKPKFGLPPLVKFN